MGRNVDKLDVLVEFLKKQTHATLIFQKSNLDNLLFVFQLLQD